MKILITGASSGFGKLTASLLLAEGHTVIAGIRGGAQRRIFTDAELATGRLQIVDLHLDRPATFPKIETLDVLINNAGYGALGPIEEQSEADIRKQMDVNAIGPMLLTNALLPALRASRGRVLNVTGVVGYIAFPFYAVYCASKFALEGYSEALAYDLRPFGVQVGIVQPGGFRTGFTDTAADSAAMVPVSSPYKARAEAMTAFLRTEAVKMNGDPLAVARTLVRLCQVDRVPLRTKVGPDAFMLAALGWLMPASVKTWLIDFVMARSLFQSGNTKALSPTVK